jgi:hypothetical protein
MREREKKWQETGFSARVLHKRSEKMHQTRKYKKNGSAAIKEKLKTIKKEKARSPHRSRRRRRRVC